MRNQIQMAERAGVRAATINSANREEWDEIERRVRSGEVDILLISPERLNNVRFRQDVLPDLVATVGLLVVDEAHCISD
jgi:ATP-dependent DNA helicase RecQ